MDHAVQVFCTGGALVLLFISIGVAEYQRRQAVKSREEAAKTTLELDRGLSEKQAVEKQRDEARAERDAARRLVALSEDERERMRRAKNIVGQLVVVLEVEGNAKLGNSAQ